MSSPLLTIAIPTYNRSRELDRQLAWAVEAIAGRWQDVELIVSDNASPDETPHVCQTWRRLSDDR
ncbi:MAG: glycosyltransferase, partial [Thermoflexales bacterium]|nr:glycosyltransferase [Thermoflexales bacterium]